MKRKGWKEEWNSQSCTSIKIFSCSYHIHVIVRPLNAHLSILATLLVVDTNGLFDSIGLLSRFVCSFVKSALFECRYLI